MKRSSENKINRNKIKKDYRFKRKLEGDKSAQEKKIQHTLYLFRNVQFPCVEHLTTQNMKNVQNAVIILLRNDIKFSFTALAVNVIYLIENEETIPLLVFY